MRKFTNALCVAALTAVIPATPASADGAVILEGGDCLGAVPDGSGGLSNVFVTGFYKDRKTKSGITNLTCHFDLTDEQAPPKSVKAVGFPCNTFAGLTTNSRIQASPGGRMVMTCSIKK